MRIVQGARDDECLASYVQGWRDRSRREAEAAAVWRARVRKRLDIVVEVLARNFGVSRIVLFGSLARAEAAPGSDVDLLVSGIGAERIIEATVAAERILGEARVDLVPVELARLAVRDRAESEGTILYVRR
jgi:predicted nucleotidyltransferase